MHVNRIHWALDYDPETYEPRWRHDKWAIMPSRDYEGYCCYALFEYDDGWNETWFSSTVRDLMESLTPEILGKYASIP